MRVLIAILAVLLFSSTLWTGEYYSRGLIAAHAGLASLTKSNTPEPDVPRVPRSECRECGGTGIVGDGNTKLPCGNCYDDAKNLNDLGVIVPKVNEGRQFVPPSFDVTKYRRSTGEWGTRRWLEDGVEKKSKVWVPAGKLLRLKKQTKSELQVRKAPARRAMCFT